MKKFTRILFLLLGLQALCCSSIVSQTINFGGAPDTFIITGANGQMVNESITLAGAPGTVIWLFNDFGDFSFVNTQTSSFNGLEISLPAGANETVSNALPLTIQGTPSAAFDGATCTLEVTNEDATVRDTIRFFISVRNPVSVGFVLDRSGSMGNPPAGGVGTRWEVLEAASAQFLNTLDVFDLAGDQVCLTYFADSDVTPPGSTGASLVGVEGNVGALITEIGATSPSGWTALGDGIVSSQNKLNAGPAANNKVMFIFTDGEQNRGDQVFDDGTRTVGGTVFNSDCIYAIGTAGAAMPATATLLQNIATASGGAAFFVDETSSAGVAMDINGVSNGFFTTTFQEILSGCSPQIVEIQEGKGAGVRIDPTVGPPVPQDHTFNVNRHVGRVSFQVSSASDNIRIQVQKDGIDVTKFGTNRNGAGYYVFNLDFPAGRVPNMRPNGDWNVKVWAERNRSYSLTCVVDDHLLNLTAEAHQGELVLEEVMKPVVTLALLDSGITNARVTATISRPGDDRGHLLATTNVDGSGTSQNDPGSVGYQKYLDLIAQNPQFAKSMQLNPNQITLTHQGKGRYTGDFTRTGVSGVYQVKFTITGNHPAIGKFTRTVLRSIVVVPPPIDIAASGATVSPSKGGSSITFRPAYKLKNGQLRYYGPSFGRYFNVSGNGIKMAGVTENPDGSYVINVQGDASSKMTLSLLGKEVYKGKVENFATAGGDAGLLDQLKNWWEGMGLPMWLFWILVVVVLAILGLIARKKKTP
ncbi:MAG: VWA domain-containing protein [Bacteroidia bacterium]